MNSPEDEAPKEPERHRLSRWPVIPTGMNATSASQVGLFIIVLGYVLHQMKPVLMPLVLAILVSLIVHPVYMGLRNIRLPRFLCATITLIGLVGLIVLGCYQVLLPAAEWMRNVDKDTMVERVQRVFKPMKEVRAELTQMANRVEKATEPEKGAAAAGADTEGSQAELGDVVIPVERPPSVEVETAVAEPPVQVEIHEDPISAIWEGGQDLVIGTMAFLLMVLFILAYGNRIVRELNQDEKTASVLSRMGSEVSRYLFTITVINSCLGICVALAMWGMGMPRPMLWGIMVMVMNYIPYVGALIGAFVMFLAAAVNFEQPGMVLAVPLVYFTLNAIEGNLITPMVLGGRFRVNPLVVFVWISAWAGFWGVAGILIAMPALVIFKIVCENTESMDRVRKVLEA